VDPKTKKNFCTVKLNSISIREICHQRKTITSNSSRTGKNRRARPKTFVYIRVANLEDFSPKKANLAIFLKNVLGPL
jgi:hypothetical protein